MNYKQLEKAWTKRRGAASTTKAMFNSALVMRKADNGDFTFYRKKTTYLKDPATNNWEKQPVQELHWATVTTADVVTFHYIDGNNDNQAKNLVSKLAGIRLYSDSGRCKMYEHQLRVSKRHSSSEPPTTHPFAAGFKYDMTNRVILWAPEDVKKVTNKEAAKPIVKYVREVIKVMEVMKRIGAFDGVKKQGWYERKTKLETTNVFDMTEDTMALLAELAYTEADSITQRVPDYDGVWLQDGFGGTKYVRVNRSPQEVEAMYWNKLKKNAAERLRKYLKEKHGAYDKVSV